MQDDSLETNEVNQSTSELPAQSLLSDTAPSLKPPVTRRRSRWLIPGAMILVAISILGGALLVSRGNEAPKEPQKPTSVVINTQSLDNGTLNKLVSQAAPNQPTTNQLVITPETLFKNNVLVDRNLEVNGNATFRGSSTTAGNAVVGGSLSVGGQLSAGSINVGALNVTNLVASGNLTFGGHIIPSGSTPIARASSASSGGSVTVTGNDTAGTVTIAMGEGQLQIGELAIITFRTTFTGTPKVQITPITGDTAALRYYATRSADHFTINTVSLPTRDTNYTFDYHVTQ